MGNWVVHPQLSAANDVQYLKEVLKSAHLYGHKSGKVIGVVGPSRDRAFSYCWKPICGPYNLEIVPYPLNTEFRRRISYAVWRQFNADLSIDQFKNEWWCRWSSRAYAPCYVICSHVGCRSAERDYFRWRIIIDHYTKHLFHPMLIDVQLFTPFTKEEMCCHYLPSAIGFIIANDPAELHSIPLPEPGVSSGYLLNQKYAGVCNYSRATVPVSFPEFTVVPPPFFPEAPALAMKGPQRPLQGCDLCCCCAASGMRTSLATSSLLNEAPAVVPLGAATKRQGSLLPDMRLVSNASGLNTAGKVAPVSAQRDAPQEYPQAQYMACDVQMVPVSSAVVQLGAV